MLLASRPIPLYKGSTTNIRPIAIGELFTRIAGNIILKEIDGTKLFPDIQFGVRVSGGAERAIHITQAILETASQDPSIICLSVDLSNAFNICSRSRIMQTLLDTPPSSALRPMFHWSHQSSSHLLVYNTQARDAESVSSRPRIRRRSQTR